jgi:putative phosphoribosyl transferase
MLFEDRREAGARLGAELARRRLAAEAGGVGAAPAGRPPLVLALPRGGVPVAEGVAAALGAPLEVRHGPGRTLGRQPQGGVEQADSA